MRRAAIVLLLVLAACGPRSVGVGESQSGQTSEIEPGQKLEIELSENAAVGYTWDLTSEPDPAVVRFLEREYAADDPDTEGGGGIVTFTFEGVAVGTTSLVLSRDYRDEGVDRTFRLTIEVVEEP